MCLSKCRRGPHPTLLHTQHHGVSVLAVTRKRRASGGIARPRGKAWGLIRADVIRFTHLRVPFPVSCAHFANTGCRQDDLTELCRATPTQGFLSVVLVNCYLFFPGNIDAAR